MWLLRYLRLKLQWQGLQATSPLRADCSARTFVITYEDLQGIDHTENLNPLTLSLLWLSQVNHRNIGQAWSSTIQKRLRHNNIWLMPYSKIPQKPDSQWNGEHHGKLVSIDQPDNIIGSQRKSVWSLDCTGGLQSGFLVLHLCKPVPNSNFPNSPF